MFCQLPNYLKSGENKGTTSRKTTSEESLIRMGIFMFFPYFRYFAMGKIPKSGENMTIDKFWSSFYNLRWFWSCPQASLTPSWCPWPHRAVAADQHQHSSRPTTRAEQRWVHWLQCLIRKWSCVNHQFQFNTQIAYKPTYMAHDLYYLLLFNYWHWHKI